MFVFQVSEDKNVTGKLVGTTNSASGRRKPKLPTPPSSPIINSSNSRTSSTPSPPPPPPNPDNELFHHNAEQPLPPPPVVIGSGSGTNDRRNINLAAVKYKNSALQYGNTIQHQRRHSNDASSAGALNSRFNHGGFTQMAVTGIYSPSDSMNQPVRRSVPTPDSTGYMNSTSYSGSNGSMLSDKQYYEDSHQSTPPGKLLSARQPASTPKRESPATIAAKEAPGWQMFLGMKSSTVNFTSEEANKFRAARDSSKTRSLRRDSVNSNSLDNTNSPNKEDKVLHDNRPRTRRNDIRDITRIKADELKGLRREESTKLRRTESRGRKRPENPNRSPELENINPNQKRPSVTGGSQVQSQQQAGSNNSILHNHRKGQNDKYFGKSMSYEDKTQGHEDDDMLPSGQTSDSTNAANNKQHSLHLSRERSLKSISNWWKNSLEAGPAPPPGADKLAGDANGVVSPQTANVNPSTPSPRHNHSHSDSGISSLSGRSSCMSPMSDLSSSSSGSSRTSLRSASIVSASNIPLESDECCIASVGNESIPSVAATNTVGELEFQDLCRDILMFSPQDSRMANAIRKFLLLLFF